VIDGPIWAHVRSDLSDVRLYDGDVQVPYALSEEHAASSTEEREARILNLECARRTEFDLDVGARSSITRSCFM